jgi:hypothetical protein
VFWTAGLTTAECTRHHELQLELFDGSHKVFSQKPRILLKLCPRDQQTAVTGLYLVQSVLVFKTLVEEMSALAKLGDMYSDDLPNPSSLQSEIHTWHLKWRQEKQDHGEQSLPTTLSFTLPRASSLSPNITELLHLLCTKPVTSCSAERSFSGLKRIKTTFRSTMGNERLTSQALLHLHRDIDIPEVHVVDEFARRHPRRLELLNILAD